MVSIESYGGYHWRSPGYVGTRRYKECTLVLDMIDGRQDALVWRGSISKALGNPGNAEQAIDKAVNKLLKNFPPESK